MDNVKKRFLEEFGLVEEYISHKTNLKEGPEAVRKLLIYLYRNPGSTTYEVSQEMELPVPLVSAIRKELKKINFIPKNGSFMLSEDGANYIEKMGVKKKGVCTCEICDGFGYISENYDDYLSELEKLLIDTPKPNTMIDQSRATVETTLERALLMDYNLDIDGKKILFMGDDDMTSLSINLVGNPLEVYVLDIDKRVLDFIDNVSKKKNFPIKTVEYDVRSELPDFLKEKFDVFVTDPPYTINGAKVFISRCVDGMKKEVGKRGYISFGKKPPSEILEFEKNIISMNMIIDDIYHKFNKYEGASILANQSTMYVVSTTKSTRPLIKGPYTEPFYTFELSPKIRVYKCVSCSTEYSLPQEEIKTIEELKSIGCKRCGCLLYTSPSPRD
mgnify:CR=1 FL=1